jgi:membrane-associated PAP2 superfamily phosphatase
MWIAAEIAILVLAGLAAWWLFERHPIDLAVAHLFYEPGPAGGWPWAKVRWVSFINAYLITLVTIGAVIGSLLLWLVAGRRDRRCWFAGMFLFLSLAIGPGIIINGVLKAEWGRPVPRDVVDFGGHYAYRHISNPGVSGPPERGGDGRSFPSGHASIAFWTTAFYFLLRRRRPQIAFAVLSATLGFGALVAFARVGAGRHFISDVVWSGIIVLAVNCLLYHALVFWQSRRALNPRAASASGDAPQGLPAAAFIPARGADTG